jgi:hypothetical protein
LFWPKSIKNHSPAGFDFPILAILIFHVYLNQLKIEKHGFQTDSGVDQNGQQIKHW